MPVAAPEFIRLNRAPAETIGGFTSIPSNQLHALSSFFVEGNILI